MGRLIYLLLVGLVVSLGCKDEPRPPRVSPVRSDHRSLATAIETYFIDNNSYPAHTNDPDLAIGKLPAGYEVYTFRAAHTGNLQTLTTPIAYITEYWNDYFYPDPDVNYMYYTIGEGWILWCAGPDGDYDLEVSAYDPDIPQPSLHLLTGGGKRGAYSYDPTNGTISNGDVWRVKQ